MLFLRCVSLNISISWIVTHIIRIDTRNFNTVDSLTQRLVAKWFPIHDFSTSLEMSSRHVLRRVIKFKSSSITIESNLISHPCTVRLFRQETPSGDSSITSDVPRVLLGTFPEIPSLDYYRNSFWVFLQKSIWGIEEEVLSEGFLQGFTLGVPPNLGGFIQIFSIETSPRATRGFPELFLRY